MGKGNFEYDNGVVGKFGESISAKFLQSNNKTIELTDVSDNKFFQFCDVDFVQFVEAGHTLDEVKEDIISNKSHPYAVLYEVKTDTRTFETRNLVYELINHNKPGCMARTVADFIIYISVTEQGENITFRECVVVDTKLWRKWMVDNAKTPFMRVNAFHGNTEFDESVLNHLCNVDKMIADGVVFDRTEEFEALL